MTKSTKHSLKCLKFENKKNIDFPDDLKMLKWFNVHHFIHSNTPHKKKNIVQTIIDTVSEKNKQSQNNNQCNTVMQQVC